MSLTHRSDAPFVPSFHHSGDRGLGVRGAAVPSTGLHGPGFLYAGLTLPAEDDDEFQIVILTVPPGLESLFVREDSSATAGPVANGTYSGTYRAFRNGVSYGVGAYDIHFGSELAGALTLDAIAVSGVLAGPGVAPSATPASRRLTVEAESRRLAATPVDRRQPVSAETRRLAATPVNRRKPVTAESRRLAVPAP
jgi:hypothetical protein